MSTNELKNKIKELLLKANFEPLPITIQTELHDIPLDQLLKERQQTLSKESITNELNNNEVFFKWEGSHIETRYKRVRSLPQSEVQSLNIIFL
jgi:hypothetical protein